MCSLTCLSIHTRTEAQSDLVHTRSQASPPSLAMSQVRETQSPALELFPRKLNFTNGSCSYWCEREGGVGGDGIQSVVDWREGIDPKPTNAWLSHVLWCVCVCVCVRVQMSPDSDWLKPLKK